MNHLLHHEAWKAANDLRRADTRLRDLGQQAVGNPGVAPPGHDLVNVDDPVQGDTPVTDPLLILERDGFWQGEDGSLMLRPFFFWPGVVRHVHPVGGMIKPAPKMRLWARWTLRLLATQWQKFDGSTARGWSGGVSGADVTLIWSPAGVSLTPQNVIFPSTYTDSMPPGDTLVFHDILGGTDADGRWDITNNIVDQFNGIFIPSFL